MNLNQHVLRGSLRDWITNDLRKPAGPAWLQWLWTVLFCMLLAAAFTLLGVAMSGHWRANPEKWLNWYGKNLVVSLVIGFLIHALFDIARHWFVTPAQIKAWQPWKRTALFGGIPLLGMLVGWPLGVSLLGINIGQLLGKPQAVAFLALAIGVSLLSTVVMHHYFAAKARVIESDKRATESQLRLLQGQMEPHFLFNTLANIQSLTPLDPPKAAQMLGAFTDYLRSTLMHMRRDDSTVAQELELATAYLQLLQMRMDDRLHFTLTADATTRRALLPPMLLQPLIENAVQHGLEPQVRGGTVLVSARVEGPWLLLTVQDDGVGLPGHASHGRPGTGVALSNIRERLQSRYGSRASLTMTALTPGTRAEIKMPFEPTAP